MAFIVGWNLILEYVIGAASISKGLSLYIDSLLNDAMKNAFKQVAPISWDFLATYFDFFAFTGPLLIGLALAFGLRKSAGINNVLCVLNLGVVAFVVIAVLCNADLQYWQIDPANFSNDTTYSIGTGGFFPFGFAGTLKGAATCFFGFVGFDCIATTGEEVRNPQKTVPRALLFSLLIIFIAYFGVSVSLNSISSSPGCLPFGHRLSATLNLPLQYYFLAADVDVALLLAGAESNYPSDLMQFNNGAFFPERRGASAARFPRDWVDCGKVDCDGGWNCRLIGEPVRSFVPTASHHVS